MVPGLHLTERRVSESERQILEIKRLTLSLVSKFTELTGRDIKQSELDESLKADRPSLSVGTLTIRSHAGRAIAQRQFILQILHRLDELPLKPAYLKAVLDHRLKMRTVIIGVPGKSAVYKNMDLKLNTEFSYVDMTQIPSNAEDLIKSNAIIDGFSRPATPSNLLGLNYDNA